MLFFNTCLKKRSRPAGNTGKRAARNAHVATRRLLSAAARFKSVAPAAIIGLKDEILRRQLVTRSGLLDHGVYTASVALPLSVRVSELVSEMIVARRARARAVRIVNGTGSKTPGEPDTRYRYEVETTDTKPHPFRDRYSH